MSRTPVTAPIAILCALISASVVCAQVSSVARTTAPKLSLATDGKSDYRIVVPVRATAHELRAADELRSFIAQVTGAYLGIVTDDFPVMPREIVVGRSRRLGQVGARMDAKRIGREGFTIQTVGEHIVIAGGPERGTLYGVYAFLEDYLGCRWYTPRVSVIPRRPTVTLDPIHTTQTPAMVYRDLYYGEAHDRDFCPRVKINSAISGALPGDTCVADVPGNGLCHTIFSLIAPEEYFAEHPEYFAMRDGKRVPSEPCLSDPDVLRIVCESLKKLMDANPSTRIWSVSQMDNGDPCQCPRCKAVDDRNGGPTGSMVTFVNKVARRFPDKIVSTLAYWYTMAPPKVVKPEKNVQIIYCWDAYPREPFGGYLEGWSRIAPQLYSWFYVIPCHNAMAPWPNIRLLQAHVRNLVSHRVTGMFVEGCGETGSEFAELRVYLLAKLMWNPNIDAEAEIDGFLNAYYGAAGPSIRKYIDAMHESLVSNNDALEGHEWSRHHAGTFFAPAMLARYDALFDEAERAVANDPELLLRVERTRMTLMHAELQVGYGTVDQRLAMARRMLDIARRANVGFFGDFGYRPREEYLPAVIADLERQKGANGR